MPEDLEFGADDSDEAPRQFSMEDGSRIQRWMFYVLNI